MSIPRIDLLIWEARSELTIVSRAYTPEHAKDLSHKAKVLQQDSLIYGASKDLTLLTGDLK